MFVKWLPTLVCLGMLYHKAGSLALASQYKIMKEVINFRFQDRQVGLECSTYFLFHFTMINSFLLLGNQTMEIIPSSPSSHYTYDAIKIQVLH